MFAALLAGTLVTMLSPNAAAQNGSIAGKILDINGKPWFGLNVEAVSEQGAKYDAKTDAQGEYAIRNLRAGVYTVTITTFPSPNEKQPPVPMGQLKVTSGEEAKADMNFKDIMAKQGTEAAEKVKKQDEEKQKFEGMKAHYSAGSAFLEQERKAKEEIGRASCRERV
jgi:hypothetical protein